MADRTRFALITGCGHGGIGEALVKEYLQHNIQPIATTLPHEPTEHLDEAGILHFPLDITEESSVVDLKRSLEAITNGLLDILVNNAGIAYTMTAIDTDVSVVQNMFDVNVFGPMRMVHHFHDMLIRSSGMIVNIGSVGGIVPYIYGSSYNASKAALHHWSNTLRVEMAPLGVTVLTVISGEIGTNILKNDRKRELPKGSYYTPLADAFRRHVERIPDTTDRFVYARRVVQQSLSKYSPAWFWYGKTTFVVRFLDIFGWRTVWDYIFTFLFGLGKLKQHGNKGRMATSARM
ncbi:NAD(P)-binding protein [Xylariaceae sp. AK1471]|nr:NAD(P)-binding protein [Xylariaceae sp. AK1471]